MLLFSALVIAFVALQADATECETRSVGDKGCWLHKYRNNCLTSIDPRDAHFNEPCVWKSNGFTSGHKCEPKHYVAGESYEDCLEVRSECETRSVGNGGCYLHNDRNTCLTSIDPRDAHPNQPCMWKSDGFTSGNKCEPKNWVDAAGESYEDCLEISSGSTSGPDFIRGETGVDACPTGYDPIMDTQTCEVAAIALGLTYNANRFDWHVDAKCNWCGGCDPQDVRLSNGHGGLADWICVKQGYSLVIRQTLPYLFSPNEYRLNADDPTNENYAILDELESFRQNDGRFYFRLTWPEDSITYEWSQTSNPLTEAISGYSPISVPYTGRSWGGLEPSNSALMDGSVNHDHWFYAVGSFSIWNGGIPSYAKSDSDSSYPQQSVELYVRRESIERPTYEKCLVENPNNAGRPLCFINGEQIDVCSTTGCNGCCGSVCAWIGTYCPTTSEPTPSPTNGPTRAPSKAPTNGPTPSPTSQPTVDPTRAPSKAPTNGPTPSPTTQPTVDPTRAPSKAPTNGPTPSPTSQPTVDPTVAPSRSPSNSPSKAPTYGPTPSPTTQPTVDPTVAPSNSPSKSPTSNPTTDSPSKTPSTSPTASPTTSSPSTSPTAGDFILKVQGYAGDPQDFVDWDMTNQDQPRMNAFQFDFIRQLKHARKPCAADSWQSGKGEPSKASCAAWWTNSEWGANRSCEKCNAGTFGREQCAGTCCAHCGQFDRRKL